MRSQCEKPAPRFHSTLEGDTACSTLESEQFPPGDARSFPEELRRDPYNQDSHLDSFHRSCTQKQFERRSSILSAKRVPTASFLPRRGKTEINCRRILDNKQAHPDRVSKKTWMCSTEFRLLRVQSEAANYRCRGLTDEKIQPFVRQLLVRIPCFRLGHSSADSV